MKNKQSFIAIACPKCGVAMKLMDGGYYETTVRGEYEQRELPDYWECPRCGMRFSEQEPDPFDSGYWEHVFGGV